MPAESIQPPTAEEPIVLSEAAILIHMDEAIADYINKPGGLIPALQIAQSLFGYLPDIALHRISERFHKSFSEVAGVVSFYHFFSRRPQGKLQIRVCLGTACYVRGGKDVLAAMKKNLGLEVGGTSADRAFSLDVARCFGACGLAPVCMVGIDVHQRVSPPKVNDLLARYRTPGETSLQTPSQTGKAVLP